jgi:hypothetical protein
LRDLLAQMQLPGGQQCLIGDGVAGASHLLEQDASEPTVATRRTAAATPSQPPTAYPATIAREATATVSQCG